MVEQTTSAAITGQDSIASLVQVKLRKQAVLASVFMDVTAFANPGDTSISFPKWTNQFSVQKLTGAAKGDDQEAIFDLDKLELSEEAHIQWVIKKFDQARAKIAILQEAIGEATTQHGNQLDADIYAAFDAGITASNILTPAAVSQSSIVDMIVAANVARIPKGDRRFVFANDEYGALLKIDGFVDASKSNLDIVLSGQVGVLYGIPVFESDAVTAGNAYLAHKAACVYGFGALPMLEDAPVIEYGTGSRRWVMDQLYGVKSMNSGKLAIKLPSA